MEIVEQLPHPFTIQSHILPQKIVEMKEKKR